MILPLWFKILFSIFLFFLGASVYSFLNVVIFRVPRGEEFVKTRSHCPGCGKLLSPMELVPVVSYVCLGGKCKNCGSKIGCRDVLIEVFGGCSAIASFWVFFGKTVGSIAETAMGDFYGMILAGLTAFSLIGALTVITFIQIDMGVVKRGTVIALAVIAAVGIFTMPEVLWTDRLIGAFCLSIFVAILALAFKKSIPLGLAWMPALVGAVIGWDKLLLAALPAAIVIALVECLGILIAGKKPLGKHFKLALALGAGLATAILFGQQIVDLLGIV